MYAHADVETEPDDARDRHYGQRPMAFIAYPNHVLAYDMNRPASTSYYHKPRGPWKLKHIYALTPAGAEASL